MQSEQQPSIPNRSMLSLFQSASGSWHIPSILMVASWLVGSAVTGGFIFANLRVNRDDRLKAAAKEEQARTEAERAASIAASRMESAEQTIKSTREQLAAAEQEAKAARALAAKAEMASRPKPFKERLETLLDSLDSRLTPELKAGRPVTVSGYLKPWQYAEMQKICTEPEGKRFIVMKPGPAGMKASTDGMLTDVIISVEPGF